MLQFILDNATGLALVAGLLVRAVAAVVPAAGPACRVVLRVLPDVVGAGVDVARKVRAAKEAT